MITWFILALGASIFAALTSILAKIGIAGVNSHLATGVSWLCYHKALQLGETSKVVPIDKLSVIITMILAAAVLHEQFTPKSIIGCLLLGIGTLLMVL